MSQLFSIISHTVGEGGKLKGLEVKRIQQLLRLNKYPVLADGHWRKEHGKALVDFREQMIKADITNFYMTDGEIHLDDTRAYITPNDPILFELAYGAGVLIRLGGGWYRGIQAFLDIHEWCVKHRTSFEWERVVWGLKGFPSWGVITKTSEDGRYEFPPSNTLALNCTLYANLMMSVWQQGNIHSRPYSANISREHSGGDKHLANARYGYPLIKLCRDAKEVEANVKYKDRLYCLEAGESVWHMALLLAGKVYECTPGAACRTVPLNTWMKTHSPSWLSGPSPLSKR